MTDDDLFIARCPACGDVIEYCQGHGEIGDVRGYNILVLHDDGNHSRCHPDGCDEANPLVEEAS